VAPFDALLVDIACLGHAGSLGNAIGGILVAKRGRCAQIMAPLRGRVESHTLGATSLAPGSSCPFHDAGERIKSIAGP
jgi:hypothetical protein